MLRKKIFLYIIFLILVILLLSIVFSSCSKEKIQVMAAAENKSTELTTAQTTADENKLTESTTAKTTKPHSTSIKGSIIVGTNSFDVNQGLHITGTPIDVDIKTYRLKVSGAVDKEQSLAFDDIKNMKSVREEIELICPGFFADKGYWTGVKVIDILNLAGIKKEAKNIEFISIDDSYKKTLSIEKVKGDGFLIAYQFNDKEFSKDHGYPLRLVAKDEDGNYWVKWLGEINVLAD